MKNAEVSKRRPEAISRGAGMMTQIYTKHAKNAKNAKIWDVEGNLYIDFAPGIAVVNRGHCHLDMTAPIRELIINN